MSYLQEQREPASRRRIPPAIPMATNVRSYYVRVGNRATEIATAEDWRQLEPQLFAEPRDGNMEVWVADGVVAILIFPPARAINPDRALDVLVDRLNDAFDEWADAAACADELAPGDHKLIASAVESPCDAEPFAPEYHGNYSIGQARADFERVYRQRMGEPPQPLRPEGPVTREEAA